MAYEEILESITMVASANLSAKQYHWVKVSGDGTVTYCDDNDPAQLGILQNAPASGEAATVAVKGVSKLVVGAAVTAGQYAGSDSAGRGKSNTTATTYARGIFLDTVTLAATPTGTEVASVLLCGPFHPANAS
jgi:hypothetical protein